jgi:hypothetical protein
MRCGRPSYLTPMSLGRDRDRDFTPTSLFAGGFLVAPPSTCYRPPSGSCCGFGEYPVSCFHSDGHTRHKHMHDSPPWIHPSPSCTWPRCPVHGPVGRWPSRLGHHRWPRVHPCIASTYNLQLTTHKPQAGQIPAAAAPGSAEPPEDVVIGAILAHTKPVPRSVGLASNRARSCFYFASSLLTTSRCAWQT